MLGQCPLEQGGVVTAAGLVDPGQVEVVTDGQHQVDGLESEIGDGDRRVGGRPPLASVVD